MIDLSRFRAPPAVAGETGFEAARLAWLADYAARRTDFDAGDIESDPAVKLCETGAARETILVQAANDAGAQCMLPWANGAALDPLAANLGVERLPGEADDRLRLRAASALPGSSTAGPQAAYERIALAATPLAADIAAASPAPGRALVTALVAAGSEELALDSLPPAPGEAMRALLEFGAAPAYYQPGVSGDLLGGSLQLAADIAISAIAFVYAARGPSRLEVTTQGGDLAAWRGGGLNLFMHDGEDGIELPGPVAQQNGRTLRFLIDDDSAGETWLQARAGGRVLAIAAPAGAIDVTSSAREQRMLHAIRAELGRRDVRPMGDIVTVRAAARTAWNLVATIAVGAGADSGAVLAAARDAVRAYGDSARRVGGAVKRGGLFAALYRPGVIDASISEPAGDIDAAGDAAPELGAVQVELR